MLPKREGEREWLTFFHVFIYWHRSTNCQLWQIFDLTLNRDKKKNSSLFPPFFLILLNTSKRGIYIHKEAKVNPFLTTEIDSIKFPHYLPLLSPFPPYLTHIVWCMGMYEDWLSPNINVNTMMKYYLNKCLATYFPCILLFPPSLSLPQIHTLDMFLLLPSGHGDHIHPERIK